MFDDSINHPDHYQHIPGIEAIDICAHFNFCLGNALKYIYRNGKKGSSEDAIKDLRKAIWYINKEIEIRSMRDSGITLVTPQVLKK
jgi:hypothetical protein